MASGQYSGAADSRRVRYEDDAGRSARRHLFRLHASALRALKQAPSPSGLEPRLGGGLRLMSGH
jgi:hypothetical protein